jgi:REP element-mobilizing transposase RayT
MPRPGYLWRHVQIGTHNSWLHGSPKGFRHRHHDIHSSGDYRNPPPPHEHAGLYRYFQNLAGDEVHLSHQARSIVGRALIHYFRKRNYRLLAVSVSKVHAHLLVELPRDRAIVKHIIGDAKRWGSRAVAKQLPGRVWSGGGNFEVVGNRSYLTNSYRYVLYKQGRSAWTWSFRDSGEEGIIGRGGGEG